MSSQLAFQTYMLIFCTLHSVMYTRNNLLNSKKFVFPVFEFNDFNIQYSDVYIR